MIVTADGTVAQPDLPAGPPLGLDFLPSESAELELPDGAMLALFTNGRIDDRDQDIDVALTRLAEALAAPARTLEDVLFLVAQLARRWGTRTPRTARSSGSSRAFRTRQRARARFRKPCSTGPSTAPATPITRGRAHTTKALAAGRMMTALIQHPSELDRGQSADIVLMSITNR
ncbi:SpoIIE family protein phosphatase [Streptomyces sp. NPDC002577]